MSRLRRMECQKPSTETLSIRHRSPPQGLSPFDTEALSTETLSVLHRRERLSPFSTETFYILQFQTLPSVPHHCPSQRRCRLSRSVPACPRSQRLLIVTTASTKQLMSPSTNIIPSDLHRPPRSTATIQAPPLLRSNVGMEAPPFPSRSTVEIETTPCLPLSNVEIESLPPLPPSKVEMETLPCLSLRNDTTHILPTAETPPSPTTIESETALPFTSSPQCRKRRRSTLRIEPYVWNSNYLAVIGAMLSFNFEVTPLTPPQELIDAFMNTTSPYGDSSTPGSFAAEVDARFPGVLGYVAWNAYDIAHLNPSPEEIWMR